MSKEFKQQEIDKLKLTLNKCVTQQVNYETDSGENQSPHDKQKKLDGSPSKKAQDECRRSQTMKVPVDPNIVDQSELHFVNQLSEIPEDQSLKEENVTSKRPTENQKSSKPGLKQSDSLSDWDKESSKKSD